MKQDPYDRLRLVGFDPAGKPVIVRYKTGSWDSWYPADLCVIATSTSTILRTTPTLEDKYRPGAWFDDWEATEAGDRIAWLLEREPRTRTLPPLLSRLMPFLSKQIPGSLELWVSSIDGTQLRRVVGINWTDIDNRPHISGLSWSPTGKYVGFRYGSSYLRVRIN